MSQNEVWAIWGRSIAALVLAAAVSSRAAGEDKSRYSLVNPPPREAMREMETDRPDTTESPITVDAGHFQAEFIFVDYTRDRPNWGTTETVMALPSNLKVGLLNNVDVQFVTDPYVNERTKGRAAPARRDG